MRQFQARRVRFRNGERVSVLAVPGGSPVHEVTLFLDGYRVRGSAANTIHAVCSTLAVLYRQLESAEIDLVSRLTQGKFLTAPELKRVVAAAQVRQDELDTDTELTASNVISISRIGMRRGRVAPEERKPVDAATHATRLRYIAKYLEFVSDYIRHSLPDHQQLALKESTASGLKAFLAHVPRVSSRAKEGARVGLSIEEQEQLLHVIHPDSPDNPWTFGYVRRRNWLIVVVLLATGMRRGELLGLQIGDLASNRSTLKVYRRADAVEDARQNQPGTKTSDRQIELAPNIMRLLWGYINDDRRQIKAARSIPQVFVADDGAALSLASIDKLFLQLRAACPGLPVRLTSHVMRHTWNERFSEQAEAMGLGSVEEERARNNQQGWAENSKTGATYTRRRTAKQGRAVSLKLQEDLDAKLKSR